MTHFDLTDDDVLLGVLAGSLAEADPVPVEAVAAAKAVARLSDADAVLATLVADSLVDDQLVGFRREAPSERHRQVQDRMVSFATPEIIVDLEFTTSGLTVLGEIHPAMAVPVELVSPATTATTESDALGRFRFDAPAGPCRVRVHLAGGGVVVTAWVTR